MVISISSAVCADAVLWIEACSQTDFLRLCDAVCSYGAWFLRFVNTGDGGVVSKKHDVYCHWWHCC